MRIAALSCALAVVAGACSPREVRIQGTLADGWTDDPLFVSVAGEAEASPVRNDSFSRAGAPAGLLDLRIRTEDGEIARMSIEGLPAGTTLSLERIRRDREHDLALPSAVRLEGAEMVIINGIRMADPDALPSQVDETGTILALGGDALVVRPGDQALPDLAVVVTRDTRVTDFAGGETSLKDASPGDSVRVEGRTHSGYLYARRIVLGGEREGENEEAAPVRDEHSPGASDSRRERESGSTGYDGDDEPRRKERRGSGQEDARIPQGHRPPPGMCRDWDPNLPAGQQPPPRKC